MNEYNPTITVAMPVFKIEYFEKAINSVLNQSYESFELVILNDASPYPIEEIVNSFSDKRIRYFKNSDNIGGTNLVRVWNQCLHYARGEYFCLFSDDDVMDHHFLAELLELGIRYTNCNIFHSRVKKINSYDEIIGFTPTCPEFESGLDFIWHIIYGYRLMFAPDFMVRTSKLLENGGFIEFPLAWGSDYATWINLAQKGGIGYTQKPLFSWRLSESNISVIGNVDQRLVALRNYKIWMDEFIKNFPSNSELDNEKIKQIKDEISPFFRKKREYLLNSQLNKNLFAVNLFNTIRNSSRFEIGLLKVLFLTFRNLLRCSLKN